LSRGCPSSPRLAGDQFRFGRVDAIRAVPSSAELTKPEKPNIIADQNRSNYKSDGLLKDNGFGELSWTCSENPSAPEVKNASQLNGANFTFSVFRNLSY
jgi:hypothetical protein